MTTNTITIEIAPNSLPWDRLQATPLDGDLAVVLNDALGYPLASGDVITVTEDRVTGIVSRGDRLQVYVGLDGPVSGSRWEDRLLEEIRHALVDLGFEFSYAAMDAVWGHIPASLDLGDVATSALDELLSYGLPPGSHELRDLTLVFAVMSCPCSPLDLAFRNCEEHLSVAAPLGSIFRIYENSLN